MVQNIIYAHLFSKTKKIFNPLTEAVYEQKG